MKVPSHRPPAAVVRLTPGRPGPAWSVNRTTYVTNVRVPLATIGRNSGLGIHAICLLSLLVTRTLATNIPGAGCKWLSSESATGTAEPGRHQENVQCECPLPGILGQQLPPPVNFKVPAATAGCHGSQGTRNGALTEDSKAWSYRSCVFQRSCRTGTARLPNYWQVGSGPGTGKAATSRLPGRPT